MLAEKERPGTDGRENLIEILRKYAANVTKFVSIVCDFIRYGESTLVTNKKRAYNPHLKKAARASSIFPYLSLLCTRKGK